MINETTPHNSQAVELFTNHLPEWFSPIVIKAHIQSCEKNVEFSYASPINLKDALARNIDWNILDVKELFIQTEGNEIQVGSEALSDFFEQFVNSEQARESKSVSNSDQTVLEESLENLQKSLLKTLGDIDSTNEAAVLLERLEIENKLYKEYVKHASENSEFWNPIMRDNGDGTLSVYTREQFSRVFVRLLPMWSFLIAERQTQTILSDGETTRDLIRKSMPTKEDILTATFEIRSWWTIQNVAAMLNIVALMWLIIFKLITPLFQ